MQGLFRDLAFVGGMQVEELAMCMGHAADFGHAQFEARLVTAKVIADQLAAPAVQEVSGVLAGSAWAEVINHGAQACAGA